MSFLSYLYVGVSILTALAAMNLIMVRLRHSTAAFRLAFVFVAVGCLSNVTAVLSGVYTQISPGQILLNVGICAALVGMARGRPEERQAAAGQAAGSGQRRTHKEQRV
jgi:hypothetical protein